MMFAEQLPIDPPTAGRPRLLDLCCGEQGAGVGYSRAGFDVTGVDLSERAARRAPLPFILGDAVAYLAAHGHEYDAVHVSPPCPAYSVATPATHRDRHPRLIEPLRELLVALGKPYVIENVVGAPLLDPVMLCGSMFGVEALDDDGTRIRLERSPHPRTCSATEDLADGRQGPAVAPGGRHWKVTGPWNDQSAVIVMSSPG